MKKYFLLIAAIIAGFVLFSCKGDPGPAGAQGEDGTPLYVQMFQNESYPNTSYQNVDDTVILEDHPNNNYGNCYENAITSIFLGKSRSLLKFNNIDNFIPANVTIKDAYIVIYGYNSVTYTVSYISAYKLTRTWTEGNGDCNGSATTNASWNYYSGTSIWTNPGGDFDITPVSDAVKINTFAAYHTLKLNTQLVKEWIQSPTTNYGILIKTTDETKDYLIIIASSETVDLYKRPKLVVYYTFQ